MARLKKDGTPDKRFKSATAKKSVRFAPTVKQKMIGAKRIKRKGGGGVEGKVKRAGTVNRNMMLSRNLKEFKSRRAFATGGKKTAPAPAKKKRIIIIKKRTPAPPSKGKRLFPATKFKDKETKFSGLRAKRAGFLKANPGASKQMADNFMQSVRDRKMAKSRQGPDTRAVYLLGMKFKNVAERDKFKAQERRLDLMRNNY